ncbi:MAG: inositol monophosphatase [Actinomycetota bacterium]|nr:inositol monophosphatase [Actinomycetota bacterium]
MSDSGLLDLLHTTVDAVQAALGDIDDWGPAGTRPGQYRSDLVADEAAVDRLTAAGMGVLSEESGRHHPERAITVVVDPLDGSTNASRALSWWACSLCAVDEHGPLTAVVADLVHGTRYTATRGGGAWADGRPLATSGCTRMSDALVGVNGLPDRHLGWAQFRALGAAALDLCSVAAGSMDAYADLTESGLAPWDYMGALLICREAGAAVEEVRDRELVVTEEGERRSPCAAATPALLASLRRALVDPG